jgi:hypothetical protein
MVADIVLRSLTTIQQLTLNYLGFAGAALSLLIGLAEASEPTGQEDDD